MKEDLSQSTHIQSDIPIPSPKQDFKTKLSLFFMVAITLLILSSISLSILSKKFNFLFLSPQFPTKTTVLYFIIYSCICLMVVEWVSQFLNYFGQVQQLERIQKALNQGSLTIIQYLSAFALLIYIDWMKAEKNSYEFASLMETFMFGGIIYYIALLLIEDVPYISLRMVGIGLQTFPIVWLAGDIASSKML